MWGTSAQPPVTINGTQPEHGSATGTGTVAAEPQPSLSFHPVSRAPPRVCECVSAIGSRVQIRVTTIALSLRPGYLIRRRSVQGMKLSVILTFRNWNGSTKTRPENRVTDGCFPGACKTGFLPPARPGHCGRLSGKLPTDQAVFPAGWERPSFGRSVGSRMTVPPLWVQGCGGSPGDGKAPAQAGVSSPSPPGPCVTYASEAPRCFSKLRSGQGFGDPASHWGCRFQIGLEGLPRLSETGEREKKTDRQGACVFKGGRFSRLLVWIPQGDPEVGGWGVHLEATPGRSAKSHQGHLIGLVPQWVTGAETCWGNRKSVTDTRLRVFPPEGQGAGVFIHQLRSATRAGCRGTPGNPGGRGGREGKEGRKDSPK